MRGIHWSPVVSLTNAHVDSGFMLWHHYDHRSMQYPLLHLWGVTYQARTLTARFMGQHGAHLGPTGPRWTLCGPLESCYLGMHATREKTEKLIVIGFYSISRPRISLAFFILISWNSLSWFCYLLACEKGIQGRNWTQYYGIRTPQYEWFIARQFLSEVLYIVAKKVSELSYVFIGISVCTARPKETQNKKKQCLWSFLTHIKRD